MCEFSCTVGSSLQPHSFKSAEHKDITNQSTYVAIECNVFTTLLCCYAEPLMKDLHKLVIPNVAAEWKMVADYLEIDQTTIDIIEKQCRNDPVKCCTELFRKWINSNCGQGPKCWSTLITILKEIKEFTAITNWIEQMLKCKQDNLLPGIRKCGLFA